MCEICLDVCSCAQQGGRGSWQLCYWPGLQAAPSLHWPIHHCCLDTRSSSGSSKPLRWEPLKLCRCSMRRPSFAPARHPNCFGISLAACWFSSFVLWWKSNLNLLPLLRKCLEQLSLTHCYKCHVNNNKKKKMWKMIWIVRIKILVPTGSDQSGAGREKCWVPEKCFKAYWKNIATLLPF